MKVSLTKQHKHHEPLTCPVCEETVYLDMQMPGGYECICGRHIGSVYEEKDGTTSIAVNVSLSGPQAYKHLVKSLAAGESDDLRT
jgi:hypothetical protein